MKRTDDELIETMINHEGSEYAEALEALVNINDYASYLSENFAKEIAKEVKRQARRIRKDFKITDVVIDRIATDKYTEITYIGK